MAVPQRTLSWLYSVLTKDHYDPKQTYHDPNRAYHDVAHALAQYPSLSPRTDVYTYENGFSALLLHLVGTLPVVFRGTTYRFPVALWIPNTYPREPPMVYVTPPQDMTVRSGQHVTLEGRVYHHYLAHWAEAWDRSTISDFLSILRDVFAKEPPVRYRQQLPAQPQAQHVQTPPPVPPLPPGTGPSPAPAQTQPPHSLLNLDRHLRISNYLHKPQIGIDRPPPLPPLPPKDHDHRRASSISANLSGAGSQAPQQYVSSQYPPPQSMGHPISPSMTPGPSATPSRNINAPVVPASSQRHQYGRQGVPYTPQAPPLPQQISQQPQSQPPQSQWSGYQSHPLQQQPRQQPNVPSGPPYPEHSPHPSNQPRAPAPPAAPAPKTEAPDLLTSPFELELPSFAPTGPAPPIPPNPEKDALLHAVSKTMRETLVTHASQSEVAAQSLVSQSHSLHAAMTTLQTELAALNTLHSTLQSNTSILQQSIHRADATIADAQARSAASVSSTTASTSTSAPSDPSSGLPPIDEVLVAPTVVGKQLYDLAAEEQGLQHALYALQAALVRGVIGVDSWSRHTRGLAREAFLKRALISKIGRGMGLETVS
ncbi:uncharacterized protein N7483_004989 [Penicillium malachiteum]|uniref:uncharacterized protein n=1 Tax=Penicillium malachiteum TaxID=1324776 RepID=UPI002546D2C9|nr:uncharacterized protein N7483_004989 [Penicillium malachiteum]KAJ5730481.1 hypothetical protein N7483_004989 [Penicillium malachiteum]